MRSSRFIHCIVLVFTLASSSAAWAEQSEVNTGLPLVRLQIGGHTLTAEVASTPEQQQTGLMNRRSLPANHGMVFVFAQSQPVCMWMKNTLIPLSVAFITTDGRVVNIADMQPQTEDVHCGQTDVRYALETPLHWFAQHSIRPGAQVLGLPVPSR